MTVRDIPAHLMKISDGSAAIMSTSPTQRFMTASGSTRWPMGVEVSDEC